MAVYFKGDRLAKAEGSSIQAAEMNAAKLGKLEIYFQILPLQLPQILEVKIKNFGHIATPGDKSTH